MIRDTIVNYLARFSDITFLGRNRSRIVLGTDRKTTRDSGYGDGGQNEVESASVDLVAGFAPDSGNVDMKNDKSRVYIAEKTDPDGYFDITVGDSITAEPSVVAISDHIRIKGRKTIKIVGSNFSIIVNDQGEATVECQKMTVSCPDVKLGGPEASEVPAWASKVLTELQKIQFTFKTFVPGGGGASFPNLYIAPTSVNQIGATKTKVE